MSHSKGIIASAEEALYTFVEFANVVRLSLSELGYHNTEFDNRLDTVLKVKSDVQAFSAIGHYITTVTHSFLHRNIPTNVRKFYLEDYEIVNEGVKESLLRALSLLTPILEYTAALDNLKAPMMPITHTKAWKTYCEVLEDMDNLAFKVKTTKILQDIKKNNKRIDDRVIQLTEAKERFKYAQTHLLGMFETITEEITYNHVLKYCKLLPEAHIDNIYNCWNVHFMDGLEMDLAISLSHDLRVKEWESGFTSPDISSTSAVNKLVAVHGDKFSKKVKAMLDDVIKELQNPAESGEHE